MVAQHSKGTASLGAIDGLKADPIWVVWKREPRDGKLTKVPYQTNGKRARSNDPITWTTYEQADTAAKCGGYAGIGFNLFGGCGAVIDLDHFDTEGVVPAWAQAIIDAVDSYTEWSPSGQGVHIIVASDGDPLPASARKRRGNVEFYTADSGRFMTYTARVLRDVPVRVVNLAAVHGQLFGAPTAPTVTDPAVTAPSPRPTHSDHEVREAALRYNGDKARGLLDGSHSQTSEERESLLCILAFYTRDAEQLYRLATEAGFNRDDDERKLRNHDIPNALGLVKDEYSWPTGTIGPVSKPAATAAVTNAPIDLRVRLISAADIEPEKIAWAWEGRIPIGMITLIVGEGGKGKSMETTELAAGFSRGTIPGALFGTPVHVAIASAEDHWGATIVPQLIAAGADRSYIHKVEAIDADGDPDDISIDGQIADLEAACSAGNISVLIVDTVVAHIPTSSDTYKEQHVRAVLKPLSHMAERLGLSVVGVMHLNRREAKDVLTRISGSGAFGNLARSVLLFAEDPEEPEDSPVRILAHSKCNVGLKSPTLRMRITDRAADGRIGMARLTLEGKSRLTTAELLTPRGEVADLSALDEASAFIEEMLDGAGEWVEGEWMSGRPAKLMKAEAIGRGIAWRTVERAKKALGVFVYHERGVGSDFRWSLVDPADRDIWPTKPVPPPQTLNEAIAEAEAEADHAA